VKTAAPLNDQESELGPAGSTHSRLMRGAVVLACAVLAVRIAPLAFRDFRVDENLTAWVTADSFTDSISRSYRYQGQSPLYFSGIWMWRQLVGSNEFILRLPSMIATIAILWRVRVFARTWLSDTGSWLAVGLSAGVLLLGDGPVAARPYVFGALALVVATESAARWESDAQLRSGLSWCVAGVVALYMHPFAVFAIAAQAVVLAWRRPILRRQMVLVGLVGAVLCAPIVPQVMSLGARQETLVLVDQPTIGQLVFALLQPTLFVPLVICLAVARVMDTLNMPDLRGVPAPVWALAFAPQIGVFVYSHLSGSSIFILRYYGFALVGLALISATVLDQLRPRTLAFVALALSVLITTVTFLAPIETKWSDAAELVNERSAGVVFASAGYVEAADQDFIRGDAVDYLNAPLLTYGIRGPIEALPLNLDPENRTYVENLAARYRELDRIVLLERVGVQDSIDYRGEFADIAAAYAGLALTEAIDDADGLKISVFERLP